MAQVWAHSMYRNKFLVSMIVILLFCVVVTQADISQKDKPQKNSGSIVDLIVNPDANIEKIDLQTKEDMYLIAFTRSRRTGVMFSWSAHAKIWCEIAIDDRTTIAISECARARVGSVSQMSNPQPSRDLVLKIRVDEARQLLRHAKLVQEKSLREHFYVQQRIKADEDCLQKFDGSLDELKCYLEIRL